MYRIKKRMGKKGQLTIFIILGIAILIVLVLLFAGDNGLSRIFISKSPVEQIQDCISDSLNEGIDLISNQGGRINPELFYLYEDDKLNYICYTEENYKGCVMQQPALKNSVENELSNYMDDIVKNCVDGIASSLRNRGNSVNYETPSVLVELFEGSVLLIVDLSLQITSGDNLESFKDIRVEKSSRLYDFVILAGKIANDEASLGDVHVDQYTFSDKTMKIEKIKQGDGSTVYILSDRDSDQKFKFAVRSGAIPPGWLDG